MRTAFPRQMHHFLSLRGKRKRIITTPHKQSHVEANKASITGAVVYLLAAQVAALCIPADHLTSLAGAELAARPVPHVSVVTQRPVIETGAPGRHALLAALAGPTCLGLSL